MEVSDRTSVNVRQDQVRLTALKEIMIVTTHHLYISSAINDHDEKKRMTVWTPTSYQRRPVRE